MKANLPAEKHCWVQMSLGKMEISHMGLKTTLFMYKNLSRKWQNAVFSYNGFKRKNGANFRLS